LVAEIRSLCAKGGTGRAFDLISVKATLTEFEGNPSMVRAFAMMSTATGAQPSISKTTEQIMPTGSVDSALPGGGEHLTTPSAIPARPASEEAGQRSRAIIPGDDPGDQQPPKSTPWPSRLT
jgi:hypothetical protein